MCVSVDSSSHHLSSLHSSVGWLLSSCGYHGDVHWLDVLLIVCVLCVICLPTLALPVTASQKVEHCRVVMKISAIILWYFFSCSNIYGPWDEATIQV